MIISTELSCGLTGDCCATISSKCEWHGKGREDCPCNIPRIWPLRRRSCGPSGVPQAVNLIREVQFLQAKDRVVILYQRDHQVRWVWLNRDHSAHPAPSWYGESVGHYEGDTLVVDTIGQKAHKMSVVDPFGTPHT